MKHRRTVDDVVYDAVVFEEIRRTTVGNIVERVVSETIDYDVGDAIRFIITDTIRDYNKGL